VWYIPIGRRGWRHFNLVRMSDVQSGEDLGHYNLVRVSGRCNLARVWSKK
jgi:hypothetical protein